MNDYKFFIEQELKELERERERIEEHTRWVVWAQGSKNKNINWRIYWSRYHHNKEHYTPEEVIERLEKMK